MAIYHLQAKPVSRSTGRSATAAAAYRSGSEIADQRTGDVYDYSRKRGVEHTEIVLPDYAARHDINWPRERATLWNAAELAEKRRDSRVAREYEVALPAELNAEQRQDLAREFAQHIADRHGCAVDIALHAPHRAGDQRNHHAHLLATTRRITPEGLGDKTTIELSDTNRKKQGLGPAATEIETIRERWATMSNAALARHGHDARIDHRTLAAQREDARRVGDAERAEELNRAPTKHLGVAATSMERRGERTDLGEFNRRIAEAAEAGRLERERQAIDRSIIDVSGDLAAALRQRDVARTVQDYKQARAQEGSGRDGLRPDKRADRAAGPDGPDGPDKGPAKNSAESGPASPTPGLAPNQATPQTREQFIKDVRSQALQDWAALRAAGKVPGLTPGRGGGLGAGLGAGALPGRQGGPGPGAKLGTGPGITPGSGRATDPADLAEQRQAADRFEHERLLREILEREQREQREREQREQREQREREQRDRDNGHRRHRDQGLDR